MARFIKLRVQDQGDMYINSDHVIYAVRKMIDGTEYTDIYFVEGSYPDKGGMRISEGLDSVASKLKS